MQFRLTKDTVIDGNDLKPWGVFGTVKAGTILEGEPIEEWPKHGDRYWFVNSWGTVNSDSFEGDIGSHLGRKQIGNIFRTEAECQAMCDKFKQLLKK